MRRRRVVVLAAAGATVLLNTGCARAAPATTTSTPTATRVATPAAAALTSRVWGRAIAVPGLAALNKGRNAEVLSVSCAAPGSCAAVGFYTDGGGHRQGFVAVEKDGRWHQAIEVPGLGNLNKGRSAEVISVSCASRGRCAAVGFYRNRGQQGFVVVEKNGRWRRAVEVPGLGALDKGGNAAVNSVSCAGPGSCAAVGAYRDGGGHQQGFVVSEVNGIWGRAVEVPGLGALNKGGSAGVSSVSCAAPGNCAAGGAYTTDAAGDRQQFVVSETNGSWGTAQEVAANLSTGKSSYAGIDSVSCGSAGNCAAGGWYSDASGVQAFVVSEQHGVWGQAVEVPGLGFLNEGGNARVSSVSCPSAGNCSAGGTYDYGGYDAAFVVSEQNGAWGQAIDVPGLRRVARETYSISVSCASAGNCGAGGWYDLGVFVASEKNGHWGKETTVPGALPFRAVNSVSCASASSCVAGGIYLGSGRGYAAQGFVT